VRRREGVRLLRTHSFLEPLAWARGATSVGALEWELRSLARDQLDLGTVVSRLKDSHAELT